MYKIHIYIVMELYGSLPNNKISKLSKLKEFSDVKVNLADTVAFSRVPAMLKTFGY